MSNETQTTGHSIHELYLPPRRYLTVLQSLRTAIDTGLELRLDDENTIGSKHTAATWGLCTDSVLVWSEPSDHHFPEHFVSSKRVSPKYRSYGQLCPMDRRAGKEGKPQEPFGCFRHCRLFKPKGALPTKTEALALYEAQIERASTEQ